MKDTPLSGMLPVAVTGGRRMENHISALKSTCLNVTHIAFTYFSLAKASSMNMANFKKIGSAIYSTTYQRRIFGNSGELY